MQNEQILIIALGLLAMAAACQVISRRLAALERKPPQPEDVEIFALVKGEERYVLIVSPPYGMEAVDTVTRWAATPDLSLTHDDGLALVQAIKTRCLGDNPLGKEPRHADHDFRL